ISHPFGGHDAAMGLTASTAIRTPPATASVTVRQARRRHSTTVTTATTASRPRPVIPCGHGRLASGIPAAHRETVMIHPTAYPAGITSTWAASGQNGAISAATNPSRVAGATAGPASRLAGTATRLISPDISTSTGVTAACAAAGTTTASAAHRGHRPPPFRAVGAAPEVGVVGHEPELGDGVVVWTGSMASVANHLLSFCESEAELGDGVIVGTGTAASADDRFLSFRGAGVESGGEGVVSPVRRVRQRGARRRMPAVAATDRAKP